MNMKKNVDLKFCKILLKKIRDLIKKIIFVQVDKDFIVDFMRSKLRGIVINFVFILVFVFYGYDVVIIFELDLILFIRDIYVLR